MTETMQVFLVLLLIMITSYICAKIVNNISDDAMFVKTIGESKNVIIYTLDDTFQAIAKFISNLFCNKNIFGKFVGVVITILSIPAIIIIWISTAILVIFNFLIKIVYLLRNRK